MDPISITVNGKLHVVEVAHETPLLWVLRDTLGLTGTKFGCGASLCGACTVHVEGEATHSCVTRIASVAGKRITTIEGLSPNGSHPVQEAWIEAQVPQCGYCQAGMIMTASALLAKNPAPTDADIDDALGGNICRCGTYQRIREAVHQAAKKPAATAPAAAAGGAR
ncbi:MAG TPA: (2Fe-2S)-binding protein [Verrucomicrobiae bacterium]|nr:(2Fe-2S)-binding protein [Verrucomicrobiae bacterium]